MGAKPDDLKFVISKERDTITEYFKDKKVLVLKRISKHHRKNKDDDKESHVNKFKELDLSSRNGFD